MTRCLVLVLGAAVLGAVPGASPAAAQTASGPQIELRAFGYAASENTESPKTFDAIFGTERLTLLGAGAEVVVGKRWLLRGRWSQFSDTGTRVFVDAGNEVFDLGIPLDATVRATEFSAGYRFVVKPKWALFAGAGRSSYSVREESNGETAKSNGSGWHVLGGGEVLPHKWVLLAAEAQWTTTGDVFTGGAAQALGESKLGGIRLAGRAGFRF